MNYFSSDLHYGHQAIIGYCNRPFKNVQEMNEALTQNINDTVTKNDVLYVLGDFAFYDPRRIKDIVRSFACPTVLIRGNHDSRIKAKHESIVGFADIYEELDMVIGGRIVTLSHYPFKGDHTPTDRYVEKRPKDFGQWLLHGHLHKEWKVKREERMINVGVDVNDYKPLSELQIINIIEGR